MIQGGCPDGTGPAAPATSSRTNSTTTRSFAARSRWPTRPEHNGSQFFIVTSDAARGSTASTPSSARSPRAWTWSTRSPRREDRWLTVPCSSGRVPRPQHSLRRTAPWWGRIVAGLQRRASSVSALPSCRPRRCGSLFAHKALNRIRRTRWRASIRSRPSSSWSPAATATPGESRREPGDRRVIATVPDISADEVRAMVADARPVQPGWEALGFEGRAGPAARAEVDHRQRRARHRHDRSETGKTYEDAQLAEIGYGAAALGFWAKNAPKYLADEKISRRPSSRARS